LGFLAAKARDFRGGQDGTTAVARRQGGDVDGRAAAGEMNQSSRAEKLRVIGMSEKRKHTERWRHGSSQVRDLRVSAI